MSILNKFMLSVIGVGFCLGIPAVADAQINQNENRARVEATSEVGAVVFRIEDIKPIVNAEGFTDKCSFTMTVFNRTDKAIKEASIDLAWQDVISAKYRVADDEVKMVEKAKDAITIITKTMDLENIPPHRQKSFLAIVDTDKCYLLFDQVNYRVTNCVAEGDKVVTRNNRRIGNGSCMSKFDYINSKNPEYYSEFKDIPESELQKQIEADKKEHLEVVKEAKDGALEALKNVNEELDKIAKMPEETADEGTAEKKADKK